MDKPTTIHLDDDDHHRRASSDAASPSPPKSPTVQWNHIFVQDESSLSSGTTQYFLYDDNRHSMSSSLTQATDTTANTHHDGTSVVQRWYHPGRGRRMVWVSFDRCNGKPQRMGLLVAVIAAAVAVEITAVYGFVRLTQSSWLHRLEPRSGRVAVIVVAWFAVMASLWCMGRLCYQTCETIMKSWQETNRSLAKATTEPVTNPCV